MIENKSSFHQDSAVQQINVRTGNVFEMSFKEADGEPDTFSVAHFVSALTAASP